MSIILAVVTVYVDQDGKMLVWDAFTTNKVRMQCMSLLFVSLRSMIFRSM